MTQTNENMITLICDEASVGLRLDVFLSKQAELTRSAAQKLIENGDVCVNEKMVVKNYKLRKGDSISLTLPEVELLEAVAENIPLEIVYEDNELLIVNKPQGMVVHPAAGHVTGTLVNALLYHAKGRLSAINGVIRPGIVHRIDKDTSGLLVVAKTNEAHLSLAEQIKEHSVSRVYFCLAHGKFKATEFTIDKALDRHPKDRKKMAVCATGGRHAVTHVSVLRQYKDCALLRCRLETGRTHQIRVHLSSMGHPVIGDPVYGPASNRFTKKYGLNGQLLHAALLGFLHPKTKEYLEFFTQPPAIFQKIIMDLDESSGCTPVDLNKR